VEISYWKNGFARRLIFKICGLTLLNPPFFFYVAAVLRSYKGFYTSSSHIRQNANPFFQ